MNENKREIRSLVTELRANEESRQIEGYAVRFEEWSRDLGGFKEIIHRTAITEELLRESDVVMCVNHDQDRMVARRKNGAGTLSLELREDGLFFSFAAPTTELGNQLLYDIRNGNLDECSFCFSIDYDDPTSERWTRDDADGMLRREIFTIAGLYDCSIVTHAAYPTTSCSARAEEVKATAEEVNKAMDAIDAEFEKL